MTAAAILTGGQARRFQGRDKSRLPAWPGGPAILDHQLATLSPLVAEVLIVTSRERSGDFASRDTMPPVRVIVDRYPGTGPLGAIVTALEATMADDLFIVAGDMPGLSGDAVRELVRRHALERPDVTVPESPRGLEPLAAVYSRGATDRLAAILASGERSLQRALQPLRLTRVAPESLGGAAVFRNVNAPGDL